jgi:phage terminase large subunit-like protein
MQYRYDEERAQKAVNFISNLKYLDEDGKIKRFELDTWKDRVVRDLFGWVTEEGRLRYRNAFIFVAKKNLKTSLSAAILLYALFGLNKYSIEAYSAASEIKQAKIVYRYAKNFIDSTPALTKRAKCTDTNKRIDFKDRNSYYESLSSDAGSKHGYNAFLVIVDELHSHKSRALYDALSQASAAKEESLFIVITHAGNNVNNACYELYQYAKDVRDGKVKDDTFYACLFELDSGDDWRDESVWGKANPSLGTGKSLSFMQSAFTKASRLKTEEINFKQLHLNMWVQASEETWIDDESWMACKSDIDVQSLAGASCIGGYDGAEVEDFCAFVLYFPEKKVLLPYFWITEARLEERIEQGHLDLLVWKKEGHLRVTRGNVIDVDVIEEDIVALSQVYDIIAIAYDQAKSRVLIGNLTEKKFKCLPHGQQKMHMHQSTVLLERMIKQKEIHHNGHPILRWMFQNAVVDRGVTDLIKPDRKRSADKIDGVVSAVMAVGLMLNDDIKKKLEKRPFRVEDYIS